MSCHCGHAETPAGFKAHLDFMYGKSALAETVETIRGISQFEAFAGFYWSWSPDERAAFDALFGEWRPTE